MSTARVEGWAQRYDRAAGELLDGDDVVAAAQFLRPRGWKAFGHALADGPVGVMQRVRGRPSPVRLPQAVLLAVTEARVHLMSARTRPGSGPVPHPTSTLATWEREEIDVEAAVAKDGTRLTIALEGGPSVELHGPPDDLTARVVEALTLSAEEAAAQADRAAPVDAAAHRDEVAPVDAAAHSEEAAPAESRLLTAATAQDAPAPDKAPAA